MNTNYTIMQSCIQCKEEFEITDDDRTFYQKMDALEPVMCPVCRQQQRVAWRNERTLHQNTCALCKKSIISSYSTNAIIGREAPFTVYCQECWGSDTWDPLAHGMDIDTSKPFFEQFKQLQSHVPRAALLNSNSENCTYTNLTANNKNCYLLFSNGYGHNEDCYYGTMFAKNHNCIDGIQLEGCELCYDCIDCTHCFGLVKGQMCSQCTDSYFLEDCRNCTNCFMCKGLRNKQYCIQNIHYSKEEYEKRIGEYHLETISGMQKASKEFDTFRLFVPSVYSFQIQSEQCTGDYIARSAKCEQCFDTTDTEDCKNLQYSVNGNKDVVDCSYTGGLELGLEIMGCVGANNCMGCNIIWWGVANLSYCELMFNGAQYCLGCIGLCGKKFCILNKQYTEEEYKRLRAEIVTRMSAKGGSASGGKKTGEWGHFFPANLSPFGYNETIAQDYFPLQKEDVVRLGFNWNDRTPGTFGAGDMESKDIPDAITDVTDDIITKKLTCETCQRNYKLVKPELEFYRKQRLPIPRQCFDCRHLARLHKRRPRTLWTRMCMCEKTDHDHTGPCAAQFETSYSPERPELIYCEQCYQKEIV